MSEKYTNFPSSKRSETALDELSLKTCEPFTIGGTRLCFVHPDDPTKCVKVLRQDRLPQHRRARTQGLKRLRALKHWDDQHKEILAYQHLVNNATPNVWEHVPEYFGQVRTDLGVGIVTRLFRNFGGDYPRNLEQELPLGMDSSLLNAIEIFKSWLQHELVITRDLLPHNIIVVRETPGFCRLVIVDGIGNSEWIPVSTWFKWFARRKIFRKISKFDHRISLLRED